MQKKQKSVHYRMLAKDLHDQKLQWDFNVHLQLLFQSQIVKARAKLVGHSPQQGTCSLSLRQFCAKNGKTAFLQPPYSPDLVLANFFLLLQLKSIGRHQSYGKKTHGSFTIAMCLLTQPSYFDSLCQKLDDSFPPAALLPRTGSWQFFLFHEIEISAERTPF